MNKKLRSVCLFSAASFSLFCHAGNYPDTNPHIAAQQAAERLVKAQIKVPENGELKIQAAALDTRIQLSHCPSALVASINGKQNMQRRVTVQVRCEQANWQVYVPVDIQLFTVVLVSAKPMKRGEYIHAENITEKLVNVRLQRSKTYTEPGALVGAQVKRTLGLHQAIQRSDICLICKNDEVNILAANSQIQVMTKGTALNDGTAGEQIKVRNLRSNTIVSARVTAKGEVKVNY